MLLKVVGFLLAAVALAGCWKNTQLPKNIGLQQGRLSELPSSPNGVSTQTSQTPKQVKALPFKQDNSEITLSAVRAALVTFGRHEIMTDADGYLHVVCITAGLRFRDDVEILLNTTEQQVEFRSQSRVGYSDMGVNRKRYDAFAVEYLAQ